MTDTKFPRKQWSREYYTMLGPFVRRGLQFKVEKGGFPGCAPVGYKNVRDGEITSIIPDRVKAPLIKDAFFFTLRGELSLREILEHVTAQGLRSRNGKPLSVSALRNILTNPTYMGYIRFKGEVVPGNHEPIIDSETFQTVQSALQAKRRH